MIHVMGDSHCNIFTGKNIIPDESPPNKPFKNDLFRVYRLGAPLAYTLKDYDTFYKSRLKVEKILHDCVGSSDTIILSFGEIDCRYHLPFQADLEKKDDFFIVSGCVIRYSTGIKEIFYPLLDKIDKIGIIGPIPTTWINEKFSNRDMPIKGTMTRRNIITRYFNELLKESINDLNIGYGCYKTKFFFLSWFHNLISNNFQTLGDFYLPDGIHLSQRAWKFVSKELKEKGFIQ